MKRVTDICFFFPASTHSAPTINASNEYPKENERNRTIQISTRKSVFILFVYCKRESLCVERAVQCYILLSFASCKMSCFVFETGARVYLFCVFAKYSRLPNYVLKRIVRVIVCSMIICDCYEYGRTGSCICTPCKKHSFTKIMKTYRRLPSRRINGYP